MLKLSKYFSFLFQLQAFGGQGEKSIRRIGMSLYIKVFIYACCIEFSHSSVIVCIGGALFANIFLSIQSYFCIFIKKKTEVHHHF